MEEQPIYKDGLIEITPNAIRLKNYYFIGSSKRVPFEKISSVAVEHVSPSTGKWQIWGPRESNNVVPSEFSGRKETKYS